MRLTLFSLFLLLTLSGCQTNPYQESSGTQLDLYQKTNAEATDIIIKALMKEGYDVRQTAPDQFVVSYDNHQFIMEPRLIEGGLSRIVVSRLFGIKTEYRDSPELFTMIVALNRNLNLAKFSMLPENKAGQIQASITFIHERLDTEEIKQFMVWMDNSLDQVKQMAPPEALHMLEKIPS